MPFTITAVPATVGGVTVPADELELATAYMETVAVLGDTVTVSWASPKSVKTIRAAHRAKSLVSHTTVTVERGGTYADRTGIESPEGLPYGVWLVPDHLIFHNGQVMARLYTVDGTMSTTYTADGETVTRDDWQGMVYKSSGRSNGGCVNVKLANLVSVTAA